MIILMKLYTINIPFPDIQYSCYEIEECILSIHSIDIILKLLSISLIVLSVDLPSITNQIRFSIC